MNKETDTYKIFRQLEERRKRANPYSFYDKDELIDEILKNEDELERYKNIIERIQSIYTSMQFSAPENMYVFIDQLGDALEELKGE